MINRNAAPRRSRVGRAGLCAMLAAAVLALVTPKASAQLDPLLFLKRCTPNIIFDVDVRNAMLQDADGNYYDPNQYDVEQQRKRCGVADGARPRSRDNIANQNNAPYYRKFLNRTFTRHRQPGRGDNFAADSVTAVGNLASGYSTFYEKTPVHGHPARATQAIDENSNVARFGLLKMRQTAPTWGTAPTASCERRRENLRRRCGRNAANHDDTAK